MIDLKNVVDDKKTTNWIRNTMTKIILFIIARNSFKKILDIGQLYIQSCIVVDDKIDNLNVCVCLKMDGNPAANWVRELMINIGGLGSQI